MRLSCKRRRPSARCSISSSRARLEHLLVRLDGTDRELNHRPEQTDHDADGPVQDESCRPGGLRRVQRLPESSWEPSADGRADERPDVAARMVLKEIRMQPPRWIEQVGPIEFSAAFGAMRLG